MCSPGVPAREGVLAELAAVDLAAVDGAGLLGWARELARFADRVQGELARVAGVVDARGAFAEAGYGSAAGFFRHGCGRSPGRAGELVAAGRGLLRLAATGKALGAGEISFDAAHVICRAVAQIGDEGAAGAAEQLMLAAARPGQPVQGPAPAGGGPADGAPAGGGPADGAPAGGAGGDGRDAAGRDSTGPDGAGRNDAGPGGGGPGGGGPGGGGPGGVAADGCAPGAGEAGLGGAGLGVAGAGGTGAAGAGGDGAGPGGASGAEAGEAEAGGGAGRSGGAGGLGAGLGAVLAAGGLDPRALRRLGDELAYRADPDGAEERERRRFERRYLSFGLTLEETGTISGACGDGLSLEIIRTAAEAFSPPGGAGDTRTAGQRRMDGLAAACQAALDTGTAPARHGAAPHLSVLVDQDTLAGAPGAAPAQAGSGAMLTAAQVMALACRAGITVLACRGGVPLDAGVSDGLCTRSFLR